MYKRQALGGASVGQTSGGRQRFSISVRLAQDYRNSLEDMKRMPLLAPGVVAVPLEAVADVIFKD